MTKVKIFIVLLLPIFATLTAQNNIGIDYYVVKDYELAKKYFLQKLSVNPAETNYYLGEIAFAEGNLEEAANYYNQGLQTNMEPYCRIGLAKINLKTGQKLEAVSSFLALQKKYPKDIDILVAIGYAYLDNQMNDEVQSLIKEMQKIEKGNPKIYVLEGDMLKSEQKFGEAAGKYDMAIYFNPNHIHAYIKVAEVYERGGWQTAVEKLKEVIERYPDYKIAYRHLGKIYTTKGYYQLAIEAYKTYFAAGYYSLDDIGRYVTALYFNKNYEEAYKMIKEGLTIAPEHFVLNRLQMYLAANTLNIEAGLKYAEQFFSLQKNQEVNEHIALDYSIYALILKEAKMFDEAIEQYKKALLLDNTVVDHYKEMATIANLNGRSDLAADYYNSYILKSLEDNIDVVDYFQLGRYYYSAATLRTAADTATMLNRHQDIQFIEAIAENEFQKDSLLNEQLFMEVAVKYYLNQADKAFDMVIELAPDGYTGYLWKARVNSLMDPDSEIGLAKPHYEKTVEILSEREEITGAIRSSLIESYSYLGYFYYLKSDNPNILLYWNKVLELDPENANAKMVLKTIK